MAKQELNFWSTTALVTGNMIGSGIFLLPATLAIYGGISLVGWVMASVGALLFANIFGNLGRLVPTAHGGPYAFTKVSLGEFPAYLVAWGYWVSIWCTNAAIAVALVGYLAVFFPVLEQQPLAAISTGLGCIWGITWINTRSIRTVGLIQLLTTILKIIPIFALGLVGIFYINVAHFSPFNLSSLSNWEALTATTTLTLFAFLGMESATIPNASTKENVKQATITGTLLTVVVYILSSIAIMGIIPAATLAKSSAPFADAAASIWGENASYWIALGAVVSTLGALNGWILMQGQIPMAAAKDQLFPSIFARTNKNGAPAVGIVLSSLLVSALMMSKYSESLVSAFTFMMTLSTLSVITPYIFCAASYALLLYKTKAQNAFPKILSAALAFAFAIWIIIGAGQAVVFWGFILLMLGIPFYVLLQIGKDKNQH